MNSTNLTVLESHLNKLKESFNNGNPSHVFSTPGFIDFFCTDGRITNRIEEKFLDEEETKKLVLQFKDRNFFEPIFIIKDGQLKRLKSRIKPSSLPGCTELFPQFA